MLLARRKVHRYAMFLVGIFIHFTFLFSIFDIYFKSPIIENVVPYQPQHEAVSDRLVLFVVDGLRAESFVNYTTMKYLRKVANSNGRWGISNTQVPTESRPGHVAVIAGFYEDPSAIAKGWKENPVDFDSVFNQTAFTWCWGTYDIVNIFTKGLTDGHIVVNSFDPYNQSFSTEKNTTHLDLWVFDKVKSFFQKAKYDENLNERLQNKKIVFFLHLLGTDTSGHTHKPKTVNFLNTIRHADQGIKEMEQIIRNYYGDDGRTTFLVTSDHGMTDWGSHGAGDDHETQTPYVIWGSGVQQVKPAQIDFESIEMSQEHRLDVNQVDLAPLMSTILSIPVPVNSIGQPIHGLLDMTLPNRAKAIHSIGRQLASQYDKKRQNVESNAIAYLYQPNEPFTKQKHDEIIAFTEKLLREQKYEEVILISEEMITLSLTGLRYYHDYYQRPLLILVTLSFLGWIAVLLKVLLEQTVNTQETASFSTYSAKTPLVNGIFLIACSIACYLVYAQSLPQQYYVYSLTAILLWWYAISPFYVWVHVFKPVTSSRKLCSLWIGILCYVLGSFAMGFSFTYRWMLSVPLLGMALWPFLTTARSHLSIGILLSWSMGCLLLSVFSFMPVVGKEVFIELVLVAGFIWLIALIFHVTKTVLPLYNKNEENKWEVILNGVQIIILIMSLQNIYVQSKRFERGTAVSFFDQATAWFIAVLSPILPLVFSRRMLCRLVAINTSVLNFYLLMSVSHEGLFMVALTFNLMCWVHIEFKLIYLDKLKLIECSFNENDHEDKASLISVERSLSNQDFRRAFFFVVYIIVAFFGTGNIASLNSFEVRWVTCFLTSFQPFLITFLILLKTLAPFLCVACSFRAVQHLTKAPSGYLNIIVLIYSNLMGLLLLYNVRNTGSWLEIGTSISQFVIVQVITLFIVLLSQIAKLLTDVSFHIVAGKVFKSRKKYV